jgi:hypothetical protein
MSWLFNPPSGYVTRQRAAQIDGEYQGEGENPNPLSLFIHDPTAEALQQAGWDRDAQPDWRAFLSQNGLDYGALNGTGQPAIFNTQTGQPVANYDRASDQAFWNAALLAGAVTGANVYGAGSAVGGGATTGTAGATGYAPATNAALAESAAGTAGYGASSAGAGGGAGQLSGGLLSGWDGLKQAGGSLLDYAAKNPKAVGGLIGAVAGGAEGGVSGGGDGGAAYSGPMPTISRGGWQPQAQAQQMAVPTFGANMNKAPGAANSGLWRFLGGK